MFHTLRTTVRSILAGHQNARNTSASTAAAVTPVMALSTSHASNMLFHNTTPNAERDSTPDSRRTDAAQHSEQAWESYGFEKKECGWGAWYLVP